MGCFERHFGECWCCSFSPALRVALACCWSQSLMQQGHRLVVGRRRGQWKQSKGPSCKSSLLWPVCALQAAGMVRGRPSGHAALPNLPCKSCSSSSISQDLTAGGGHLGGLLPSLICLQGLAVLGSQVGDVLVQQRCFGELYLVWFEHTARCRAARPRGEVRGARQEPNDHYRPFMSAAFMLLCLLASKNSS